MKNSEIKKRLSKTPYRGIISEIAREQEVTPQAIWNALYIIENPRITEIVSQKIRSRRQKYNRSKKILQSC